MFKKLEQAEELEAFLALNQKQIRLIKFFAEWCPPCHELQKNLQQLEKESFDLAILEIDVEKFPQIAQRPGFQISSLPTLLLFRPQSAKAERKEGLQSLSQLKEWVKKDGPLV